MYIKIYIKNKIIIIKITTIINIIKIITIKIIAIKIITIKIKNIKWLIKNKKINTKEMINE